MGCNDREDQCHAVCGGARCALEPGHDGPHACPMAKPPGQENVDHPPHYGGDVVHEHIKCIEAWGIIDSYTLGNATKYIARAGKKDTSPPGTLEDLRKAAWYLGKEIERREKALGLAPLVSAHAKDPLGILREARRFHSPGCDRVDSGLLPKLTGKCCPRNEAIAEYLDDLATRRQV